MSIASRLDYLGPQYFSHKPQSEADRGIALSEPKGDYGWQITDPYNTDL